MNYKMVVNLISKIMIVVGVAMVFPLLTSLISADGSWAAFLIPIALLLVIGIVFSLKTPTDRNIQAKEGFVITGLAWIIISLFGSLPFLISGVTKDFFVAFFESVSGFTTTGMTAFSNVDDLPKSILFWRAFMHFLGGMGMLVFILAILPKSSFKSMHILRAEATGPQVNKIVSKMRFTARILYAIYVVLTLAEFIMLLFSSNMSPFDALLTSFSTAGTGGFATRNSSMADYSAYTQVVVSVFMFIFSMNFNIFYLLLTGNVIAVLKSEELRVHVILVVATTLLVAWSLVDYYADFGVALRHSMFQINSASSTTGFATANFGEWPQLAKVGIWFTMFVCSEAGSTGGGFKIARWIIVFRIMASTIKKVTHPREVTLIKFEGKQLDDGTISGVIAYTFVYFSIFIMLSFLLAIGGYNAETSISTALSAINNIGLTFGDLAGTTGFQDMAWPLKLAMSFTMLVGRLEIFPILILFLPATWRKV